MAGRVPRIAGVLLVTLAAGAAAQPLSSAYPCFGAELTDSSSRLYKEDFERFTINPLVTDRAYFDWYSMNDNPVNEPCAWEVTASITDDYVQKKGVYHRANTWGNSPGDNTLMGTNFIYNKTDYEFFLMELDVRASDNDGMGLVFGYQNRNDHYRVIMMNDVWPRPAADGVNGDNNPRGHTKIQKRIRQCAGNIAFHGPNATFANSQTACHQLLNYVTGPMGYRLYSEADLFKIGLWVRPSPDNTRVHVTFWRSDITPSVQRLEIDIDPAEYKAGKVGIQLYAQQAFFDNVQIIDLKPASTYLGLSGLSFCSNAGTCGDQSGLCTCNTNAAFGDCSRVPMPTGCCNDPDATNYNSGCTSQGHNCLYNWPNNHGQVDFLHRTTSDGHIEIQASGNIAEYLPKRTMTVESWVYLRALVEWGGIVGRIQDDGSTEYGWVLGYSSSPSPGAWYFALSTVGANDGNGFLYYLRSTTVRPVLNQWAHVAATYDGATMVILVNGIQAATVATATSRQSGDILYPPSSYTVSGGGFMSIGAYHDANEYFTMNGMVDSMRIWNVVRSNSDLLTYACSRTLLGTETGLMHLWEFDERQGNEVFNSASNGLSGKLVGDMKRVREDERCTKTLPCPGQTGSGVTKFTFDGGVWSDGNAFREGWVMEDDTPVSGTGSFVRRVPPVTDAFLAQMGAGIYQGSNVWGNNPSDEMLSGTQYVYKTRTYTEFSLEFDIFNSDNDGWGAVFGYETINKGYRVMAINDIWPDRPIDNVKGPFMKIDQRVGPMCGNHAANNCPAYKTLAHNKGTYKNFKENELQHAQISVYRRPSDNKYVATFIISDEEGVSNKLEALLDDGYSGGYVGIQFYAQQAHFDNIAIADLTTARSACSGKGTCLEDSTCKCDDAKEGTSVWPDCSVKVLQACCNDPLAISYNSDCPSQNVTYCVYNFLEGAIDFSHQTVSDGHIEIPFSGSPASYLPPREMTAEAWVYMKAAQAWGGVVGYIQHDGATQRGFLLTYSQTQWGFALSTTGAAVSQPSGKLTYLYGGTVKLNQWTHVAVTYDGTLMRVFVDGILASDDASQAARSQSGDIFYPAQSSTGLFGQLFTIGSFHDPNEYYVHNGMVDEVRLWKLARSESEVLTFMQPCSVTGLVSGLAYYFKFDETQGAAVRSEVIGSLDGRIVGPVRRVAVQPTDTTSCGDPPGFTSAGCFGQSSRNTVVVDFESATLGKADGQGWTVVDDTPVAEGPSSWEIVNTITDPDGFIQGKGLYQRSNIWGNNPRDEVLSGTSIVFGTAQANSYKYFVLEMDVYCSDNDGFGPIFGWKGVNNHFRGSTIRDVWPEFPFDSMRGPFMKIEQRVGPMCANHRHATQGCPDSYKTLAALKLTTATSFPTLKLFKVMLQVYRRRDGHSEAIFAMSGGQKLAAILPPSYEGGQIGMFLYAHQMLMDNVRITPIEDDVPRTTCSNRGFCDQVTLACTCNSGVLGSFVDCSRASGVVHCNDVNATNYNPSTTPNQYDHQCIYTWTLGALDFTHVDASTGHVTVPIPTDRESTFLPQRAITVEAWVYLKSSTTWGGIVSYLQDDGNTERGWILGYNAARYYFAVSTTGAAQSQPTGRLTYLAGGTIEFNKWVHVAGTYDGRTLSIYKDGLVQATDSTTQAGDIFYPSVDYSSVFDELFTIGAYHDANEYFVINGVIDEVRVWKVARSGSQILNARCSFSLDPQTSGLLQYWNFDENSGPQVLSVGTQALTGYLRQSVKRVEQSLQCPSGDLNMCVGQVTEDPSDQYVYTFDDGQLSSDWAQVDETPINEPCRWVVRAGLEDPSNLTQGFGLYQSSNCWGNNPGDNALMGGLYLFNKNPNLLEFILEADVIHHDNDGVGVVFGYKGPDDYYRGIMINDIWPSPAVDGIGGPFQRLDRRVRAACARMPNDCPNPYETLAILKQGYVAYDEVYLHKIMLRVYKIDGGSRFRVDFTRTQDGQIVSAVIAAANYTGGRIGFQTYAQQSWFDNIRITPLGGGAVRNSCSNRGRCEVDGRCTCHAQSGQGTTVAAFDDCSRYTNASGCSDPDAINYNPRIGVYDHNCLYAFSEGAMDASHSDNAVSGHVDVDIPYAALAQQLPVRDATIEAWYYIRKATTEWGGIVGYFEDDGDSEKGWVLGYDLARVTFALSTRESLAVRTSGDSNGQLTYLAADTPFELNKWFHVAATYDGQTMRLYVDGALVKTDSTTQAGNIWYPAESYVPLAGYLFTMGAYHDRNEYNPVYGMFDDVRIWRVARSASDIQTYRCAGTVAGTATDLLHLYKFDENNGPVANDAVATGLSGFMRGDIRRVASSNVDKGVCLEASWGDDLCFGVRNPSRPSTVVTFEDFELGSAAQKEWYVIDDRPLGDATPGTWRVLRNDPDDVTGRLSTGQGVFQSANTWGNPSDNVLTGTNYVYGNSASTEFKYFVLEADINAHDNDGIGILFGFRALGDHYRAIMINDMWPSPSADGYRGPMAKIEKRVVDVPCDSIPLGGSSACPLPYKVYSVLKETYRKYDEVNMFKVKLSVRPGLNGATSVVYTTMTYNQQETNVLRATIPAEDGYNGGHVGFTLYACQIWLDNVIVTPLADDGSDIGTLSYCTGNGACSDSVGCACKTDMSFPDCTRGGACCRDPAATNFQPQCTRHEVFACSYSFERGGAVNTTRTEFGEGPGGHVSVEIDRGNHGLPKQSLTLEAWVRVTATARWGGIISFLQDDDSAQKGWVLGYRNQPDLFYFGLSTVEASGVDSDGKMTYLEGGAVELNAWTHVAGTYDGSTMRIYVNGVEVDYANPADQTTQKGAVWYPDESYMGQHEYLFTLGAFHDADTYEPLVGAMDEPRVWGRALTASEIRSGMCAGAPSSTANDLIVCYTFDEPEGNVAKTCAASGIDGFLAGNIRRIEQIYGCPSAPDCTTPGSAGPQCEPCPAGTYPAAGRVSCIDCIGLVRDATEQTDTCRACNYTQGEQPSADRSTCESGGGFVPVASCAGVGGGDCFSAVDGKTDTAYTAPMREIIVQFVDSYQIIAVAKFNPDGGDRILAFDLSVKPDGASDFQSAGEWTISLAPSAGDYEIYDGFETVPTKEVRIRVTNPATGSVELTDFRFYARNGNSGPTAAPTSPPDSDSDSEANSSSKLSAGAIVGIVIAVLVLIILIVVLVAKRGSSSSGAYDPNKADAEAHDVAPDGGASPKFENPVFEADDEDY